MRCLLAALMLTVAVPAAAQDAQLDRRVTKLEGELRAVQRKVFPGGDSRFFEPEISSAPPPAAAPGTPATSPVADLSVRVDALEHQLSTMTGQVEQQGYRLKQLEDQLAKLRGDAEYRLNALEGGKPPVTGGTPSAGAPPPAGSPFKPASPETAAAAGAPPPSPTPSTSAAAGKDPIEARYLAAYALVDAKKYPEAEAALKSFVADNPKHRRASYAQHWLGRSYLAENKPALAIQSFYANYQNNPRGERAPDSLFWLGQALEKIGKPAEACRAYGELTDVYGAKLSPALKDQSIKARAAAKCPA
jgi:TolA-binding protein